MPIDKWTLVELRPAVDPRDKTAHRFVRGTSKIDLVTSQSDEEADDRPEEVVDVLISDHHAPKVTERLAGREMVRIEGGTQGLRRTINARLEIELGTVTTVSVPGPFGALILKVAAYKTDSRARDRHVRDARGAAGLHRRPLRRARGLRRLRPLPAPDPSQPTHPRRHLLDRPVRATPHGPG